jgi:hypothetical protein
MAKLIYALIASLWTASVFAADAKPSAHTKAAAPAKSRVVDSQQIEKDLQRLPWKQFRSVIESVPKMKADVEAYGPMGWKYVEANYTTYAWKKNIDKLDDAQKKRLADLIQVAKGAK